MFNVWRDKDAEGRNQIEVTWVKFGGVPKYRRFLSFNHIPNRIIYAFIADE